MAEPGSKFGVHSTAAGAAARRRAERLEQAAMAVAGQGQLLARAATLQPIQAAAAVVALALQRAETAEAES